MRWDRLLTVLACGAMGISAAAFAPNESAPPFNAAVTLGFWWMAAGGLLLGAALASRWWTSRRGDPTWSPGGSARAHSPTSGNNISGRAWRAVPLQNPIDYPLPRDWRDQLSLIAGVILLFIAAESSSNAYRIAWLLRLSHHLQFLIFAAGVALTVKGAMGWRRRTDGTWRAVSLQIDRWEWLCIGAALLLALVIRAWRLNSSMLVLVDELNFITDITKFWSVPDHKLIFPMTGTAPYTRLFSYWQTWTVELFGRNFAGFRAVSVVLGTLTIPGLWWLARHLWDRYTALIAALLLATFPAHIHFSRLGINNIGDPLFGVWALAFFARGWRTRTRSDYVLAGAALGLTQYFHESGRLLFPAVVFAWLVWLWMTHPRRFDALLGEHLTWMIGTAALIAFPVYYVLITQDWRLTARLTSGTHSPNFWTGVIYGDNLDYRYYYTVNLADTFLIYVNKTEKLIWYGGKQPLVLTPLVPVFLLGVWHLLWRSIPLTSPLLISVRRPLSMTWRGVKGSPPDSPAVSFHDGEQELRSSAMHPGAALPLIWILLTSLGNSLLVESYVTPHYVVVFPALALVVALGIRYTLMLFVTTPRALPWHAIPQPAAHALLAAGLLIGIGQTGYYHGIHLPYFEVQYRSVRNYRDIEDALLRVSKLKPFTQVYFIMENPTLGGYNQEFMDYLSSTLTVRTLYNQDLTADDLNHLRRDRDIAFLVVPGDTATLARLREVVALPAPEFSPNLAVPDQFQYALYVVPASHAGSVPIPTDHSARQRAELQWLGLAALLVGSVWAGVVVKRRRAMYVVPEDSELDARFLRLMETAPDVRPPVGILRYLAGRLLLAAGAAYGVWINRANRLRLVIWAGGVGMLALLTLANVNPNFRLDTDVQAGLLVGGTALVALAFRSGFFANLAPRPLSTGRSGGKTGLMRFVKSPAPILAIILLAFILRVANLDTAIDRLVDEMPSINNMVQLWDDPKTPLLVPYEGVAAFTRVYSVWQTWAVKLFGANLVGLRVVSAILGTLTAAAVYRLARDLFDRETALLAALALAVFPPHIHFSRLGINNIADPLFGTLALVFLARGISGKATHHRRGLETRSGWYALAGAMLGLTQYFYEGGRLLFPAVVIGFAVFGQIHRVAPAKLREWLVFFSTAVLVSAPVFMTLAVGDLPAAPRLQATLPPGDYWREQFYAGPARAIGTALDNLKTALAIYGTQPDSSWFYGAPLLLAWVLPLFLSGVAAAAWRILHTFWRLEMTLPPGVKRGEGYRNLTSISLGLRGNAVNNQPILGALLILLWLLAAALGNSLLVAKTEIPRYVVVFPAVALAVGVGARSIIALCEHPRRGVLTGRPYIAAAVVMYLIVVQVGYYFVDHVNAFMRRFPEAAIIDDIRFRAAELPDQTHVQIITNIPIFDSDSYTLMRFTGRHERGVFISTLPSGPPMFTLSLTDLLPGRNFAFFVAPDDAAMIAALEASPVIEGPFASPSRRPPEGRYLMYFAPRELR